MKNTISDIYRCSHCGLTVEVTNPGAAPVCCGEEMVLCKENTSDGAREKHVPVLESTGQGTLVKVGSVAHPMTEEHYIQWIEIINGPYVNRCISSPVMLPKQLSMSRQVTNLLSVLTAIFTDCGKNNPGPCKQQSSLNRSFV